jgi:branched-chain amino acid transport system ATP-binding protein
MPLLTLDNVCVAYGGIPAVRDLTLRINKGEIVCLIGSNGAGKSSAIKALIGLVPTSHGAISFNGSPVTGTRTDRMVAMGIGIAPEGRRIFPGLSVLENLKVGHRKGVGSLGDRLAEVYELFPKLQQRKSQMGWSLSGGEQQMLAIGRALMGRPRLLILDEPSLGLAPLVIADVFRAITEIGKRGTSVLVAEQNAKIALGAATRGYVLEGGALVVEGTSEDLKKDPRVKEAFMGGA